VKCSQCAVAANCFLRAVSAGAVRQLARRQSVRECPKGTTLFKEGQPPRSVAVLCRGGVKLSLGRKRDRQLLRVLGPGEVIGLSAVISGNQNQETAVTTANSRLVFIKRNPLLSYLRTHAEAGVKVVEFLSKDVEAAEERLGRLAERRAKCSE
jgi:CRP/FNR family cyclic AMP-dependent transcriptional regulator